MLIYKCIRVSVCVCVRMDYMCTNALISNNEAVSMQGAKQCPDLFSIVAAVTVCFFPSFQSDEMQ